MPVLNNRVFTAAEIETWKDVLSIQEKTREEWKEARKERCKHKI